MNLLVLYAAVFVTLATVCQCKKTLSALEHFQIHNKTFDDDLKRFNADGDPADFLEGFGRLEGSAKDKPLHEHISGSDHAQAIAIQIENYSNKILGDGQYHIYYGQEWPDKKPNSIPAGGKDVVIYSDHNRIASHCGGSISWQIKEDTNGAEGGKYSAHDAPNKGPRIAFSWYISENTCKNTKYNEMAFTIDSEYYIDKKGNWINPTQNIKYNVDWKTFFKSKTSTKHHMAKHQQRIKLTELKPVFKARAIVTNGCKSTVRIQLLGTAQDTQLVTEEAGFEEIFINPLGLKGEEGTPLMSILIMGGIGVAGIILAVAIVKGIIVISKKSKAKKKHGQTEYRKVSLNDEDEE